VSYYGISEDVTPEPTPAPDPVPAKGINLAAIALIVAIAGLFMPVGADGWKFPTPGPVPPFVEPIDAASTEGSWVIVVEQTESRSLEDAKLMRDVPFQQNLAKRGLKWRPYDYDESSAAPYRAIADSVGMPAVIILGGQGVTPPGKILAKFPLPSKDELDAKIKEATGR
jgi:hypothetical protein